MIRKEAIRKVLNSEAEYFTYGVNDLGIELDWQETIKDILNMDEDDWNDGEIIELWPYSVELHWYTVDYPEIHTVFAIDENHAIQIGYGFSGEYPCPDYVTVEE